MGSITTVSSLYERIYISVKRWNYCDIKIECCIRSYYTNNYQTLLCLKNDCDKNSKTINKKSSDKEIELF